MSGKDPRTAALEAVFLAACELAESDVDVASSRVEAVRRAVKDAKSRLANLCPKGTVGVDYGNGSGSEELSNGSTLGEWNPDALLADGFEDAYIGVVYRFGMEPVALYDRNKCLQVLMKDFAAEEGLDQDEAYEMADEYLSFNTEGAWVGPGTPAFAILR